MPNYGIAHVWAQGDTVTRCVALLLLLMSMLSWTVIVVKTWNLKRLRRLIGHAEQAFWQASNLDNGIDGLREQEPSSADNPFLALALSGKEAVDHHFGTQQHLHNRIDVSEWITRCLRDAMDEVISRMQAGLAILASIGSTAPFVGLFGTVWGIYRALMAIGARGQTSIDQIAGPVGESLIMTAFGLFVAIPAVIAYNALTRANKVILSKLNRFAHGVHAFFVTGEKLTTSRRREPANVGMAGHSSGN